MATIEQWHDRHDPKEDQRGVKWDGGLGSAGVSAGEGAGEGASGIA